MQSTGRRLRGRSLTLLAAPGAEAVSRMGIAVSRKVGKAVVRNRVKRWLREVRRVLEVAGIWDLVVIASPAAATAGLAPLREELSGLTERICR